MSALHLPFVAQSDKPFFDFQMQVDGMNRAVQFLNRRFCAVLRQRLCHHVLSLDQMRKKMPRRYIHQHNSHKTSKIPDVSKKGPKVSANLTGSRPRILTYSPTNNQTESR